MMTMTVSLGAMPWQASGLLILGFVAIIALAIWNKLKKKYRRTTKAAPAPEASVTIWMLRIGSYICLFVVAVMVSFYIFGPKQFHDETKKLIQLALIVPAAFTFVATVSNKNIERKKRLLLVVGLVEAAIMTYYIVMLFLAT
ncbi:MAG: hypothetical protein QGH60_03585 [Phycisphaerae bacterium]|jgi:hypothetical protein|nr:hypothetical protein [Phycisphaerae bacterium]